MDPNVWGPGAWTFLHSLTLTYPKRPNYLDKQRYSQFFHNLQFVLPCPTCQKHYQLNVKENPIQLDSRDDLVAWLVNIHNEVNRKNGKRMLSLNEFYSHYQELYSDEPKQSDYKKYIVVLIVIVAMILLFLYFKKSKKDPPF
jgi:hypothetical protein